MTRKTDELVMQLIGNQSQTRYRYGSSTLHPGQVLIVSHSRRQEPLRLQKRQRTKRQKLEQVVESLSCNVPEMTAFSPFM